nr:uncharacterized protein MAL8P1.12-like [Hydra vulgaris]
MVRSIKGFREVNKHSKSILSLFFHPQCINISLFFNKKGADINAKDINDCTPLSLADDDRLAVANYLVENGLKIALLNDKQKDALLNYGVGNDTFHKMFYAAIRSSKAELLETLINRRLSDYNDNPTSREKLENCLGKAYEELKLKDTNDDNIKEVKASVDTVKERIDMLYAHIDQLQGYSKEDKEVDEIFLLKARFVAQNIHILKRQLKSTYDKLPWEEIEFCLLDHLKNFNNTLETIFLKEESSIKETDINGKFPKPKDGLSARKSAVSVIVKKHPCFKNLYNDYEQIKNVYSLKRMESYVELALLIDLNKEQELGILVIERTLQVIGESLKNTLESPNASNAIHKMLLYSAPKDLREIITSLRDSLSHAHTLTMKINLENSENPHLNKAKLGEIQLEDSNIEELAKTRELITELKKEFIDRTEQEQVLFNKIEEIIDSQKFRLTNVKTSYLEGLSIINKLITLKSNNLKTIQNECCYYLDESKFQKQPEKLQEIVQLVIQISNSITLRKHSNDSYKINKLLYKMIFTIELEAGRVEGISAFKKSLEKKHKDHDVIKNKVDVTLNNIENQIEEAKDKAKFQEGLKAMKEIYEVKPKLIALFSKLKDSKITRDSARQKYESLVRPLWSNEEENKKSVNNAINNEKSDMSECFKNFVKFFNFNADKKDLADKINTIIDNNFKENTEQ